VLKNAQLPEPETPKIAKIEPETPSPTILKKTIEKPLENVINSRRRSARKVKPNETAENEPVSRSYATEKACKESTPVHRTEDTHNAKNGKKSENEEFEKEEDTSGDSDFSGGNNLIGKGGKKSKKNTVFSKSQTQPHKSIHFTQQELLDTAKRQEIENEKHLQILLEQQRENALKRKAGYNKKKNKQPGNYIKYVSKIVEIPKKNDPIEVVLPKGAECVRNTITNYTVS